MKLIWSGKNALVTGGSCDLALKLAVLLIKADIKPVLTYRNEQGKKKIEKALTAYHKKYLICLLDYSKAETLDNIENQFNKSRLSEKLDYLVDFAQGDFESLISSASYEESDAYFRDNIGFRAEMLKRVTRIMIKQKKGRLIFISSTAAKSPNKGQGFYSGVKLACEALYKNIGLELGSKGITSLSLRPGYIKAGRGEKYLINNEEKVLKKIPVKKALSSSEVTESIMFFLSDSASGFNATEIVMDGGLTSGK